MRWLSEQEVSSVGLSGLYEWLDVVAERKSPSMTSRPRAGRGGWEPGGDFKSILGLLATNPSPGLPAMLIELARRHGDPVAGAIIQQLCQTSLAQGPGSEATADVLRAILGMATTGNTTRLRVLQHFARQGIAGTADLAAEAYALGVQLSNGYGFLTWLRDEDSDHRLTTDEVVAVLDRVTRLGLAAPWEEIVLRFLHFEPHRMSPEAVDVLCRNVTALPDGEFRADLTRDLLLEAGATVSGAATLARELLSSADRGKQIEGASWILRSGMDSDDCAVALAVLRDHLQQEDAEVRERAIGPVLSHGGQEACEWVRPLLRDRSADVRKYAASSLYTAVRDEPIEPLLALLEDPSRSVRLTAVKILEARGDRSAFEPLLAASRDPDERVRKAAEEALDSILAYYDRVGRWKRWLRDSDLEADSAAEALLELAGSSNSVDVRVAAIRSLGTLGVPETLPMLIRMIQDDEAAVAAAARSAIERINGAEGAPAGGPEGGGETDPGENPSPSGRQRRP